MTMDRGVSNVADENELFKRDPAAQRLNRPQRAKPKRQQHQKPKSGKGETIVIPGDGDPCPRCGVPMEIHEKSATSNCANRSITRDGSAARTRAARPRRSCRHGTR